MEAEEVLKKFGPYLDWRRMEKGWTLRELGEETGHAHSNLWRMIAGNQDPRLTDLVQIASAFNEDLTEFLEPIL